MTLDAGPLPLSGMVVLDLSQILAGPVCTMVLADMGADVLELLEAAGVVAGPIYNMAQVYQDPQVQARGMKVELDDPVLGPLPNIGIPVKLSKTPGRIRRRAPALGEHSREILLEAGLTEAQVGEMVDAGVVTAAENADLTPQI